MMFTVTVTLLPYLILSVLGLVSGDTGSGSGLGQFSKLYPEQVTATIEPDCSNNSGINGHNKAVITITWELPSDSAAQQLLEYSGELKLASTETNNVCLALNFTVIPPFPSSSKELQIRTDEQAHPIYGCHYIFILSCEDEVLEETYIILSNEPQVNLEYDCLGVYNSWSHSYILGLEWNVTTTNKCSVSSVIDEFAVSLWQGDAQIRSALIPSNTSRNIGMYFSIFYNLKALKNDFYNFQLISLTNGVPVINNHSCLVLAPRVFLPPTHLIVTDYSIVSVNLTNFVQIKATWTPPRVDIDEFDYYLVSVIDESTTKNISESILPISHSFIDTQFSTTDAISQLVILVRLFNSECQSDSCSSSWSEAVLLTKELSCSVFSHKDTITKPFSNEEEAVRSARCYAACVDMYASSILNLTIGEVWPSVSPNQFNCTTANEVDLCHKGCLISSSRSFVKNYICTYDCVLGCKSECGDSLSCRQNGGCERECEFTHCSNGCGLWNELQISSETISIDTPVPVELPITTPTMSIIGGEYWIDIKNNTANIIGQNPVDHTFLIRIVQQDGTTLYIMQESLSIPVNLTYFNCETVQLSVAAVTSFGMPTAYTDSIALIVYGETLFPSHPDHSKITFQFEEDFREGFQKHSIMNITWEKPENHDLLEYYKINVSPRLFRCGKTVDYVINDTNVTSFIVQSATPSDLPRFSCIYNVKIQSFPTRPGDNPTTVRAIIRQVTSEPPPIIVNCSDNVNQDPETGDMTVTVTWIYPFELPLIEATRHFRITPQFVTGLSTGFFGRLSQPRFVVATNLTSNVYTETFSYTPVEIDEISDTFRVKIEPIRSFLLRHRKLPSEQFCYFTARSNLPSSVEYTNYTIVELSEFRIIVAILLSTPSQAYSTNVEYELIVSQTKVPYNQSEIPTNSINILTGVATNYTINELNRFDRNVSCFFIQARVRTPFAIGHWNAPLIVGGDHCQENNSNEIASSIIIVPSSPSMESVTTQRQQYTSSSMSTIVGKKQSMRVKSTQIHEIPIHEFQYHAKVSLPIIASVITVAIIVTAITVIIVSLLILNHKKNKQLKEAVTDVIESDWMGGKKSHMTSGLVYDEWEIPADTLVMKEKLCEGIFGKVYSGHVEGPSKNMKIPSRVRNSPCIPVAIKMLKDGASGKDKRDFLNEIDILKMISQSSASPHIVTLIGCVTIQEPIVMVTSFVKHRDLWSYLQHIRKNLNNPIIDKPTAEEQPYKSLGAVLPVDLLSFAYQIASGMEYISSFGIVHHDLAARNVLVEDEKTLKISDFGMSRVMGSEEVYVKTTRGRLPWKWMSIESLQNREFNSCSDIWSYGVTLWEIATLGGFPYPSVPNNELQALLESGARLEKPSNVSTQVYDVMLSCWESTSSRRPTFSELRDVLSILISKSTGNTYIDLVANPDEAYYAMNDEDLFAELNDDNAYDHITAITAKYNHLDNSDGYDRLSQRKN